MDYTLINGVDQLYYALVTQDDADAYAANSPLRIAPLKTSLATPSANKKIDYFDNQAMFNLQAEGETKLKLEITNMPLSLQATLLGKIYDSSTESLYDINGIPPNIAVGYRALNSDGTYTLIWYLKGQFAPFDEEANTQTDSPDPKGVTLEYSALYTIHLFEVADGITKPAKKRKSTKESDIATWFDAVRVPVNGSPDAFTVTPAPADGATSQATNVAISMTFSNPPAGGAENGIGLLRNDTQAAIAVTRSISANRKVVTLAHATLTAAKTYLITLNGVRDVYGQTLTDVVYDFTTA